MNEEELAAQTAQANLLGNEAAALEDAEDDDAAEAAALRKIADDIEAGANDDDDAAAATSSTSADGATTAATTTAADDAAASAASTLDDATEAAQPQRAAIYMPVPDVASAQAELTAVAAERERVRAAYRAGDLDLDARDEQLEQLAERVKAAERTVMKAETAADYNRNLDLSIYMGRINSVKAAAKADGIDYDANPSLMQSWDAKVKGMAADPEALKKGDAWILQEAHKQVLADIHAIAKSLGLTKPGTTTKAGDATKVKEAIDKRAAKTDGVKSLGTLPQAGSTTTGDDAAEFSHLERLDGLALEAALARLSPEAQARYLGA